jgi:hypothetical protein
MNKAKLKSYAPQARKDFIAAVEARAHSARVVRDGRYAGHRAQRKEG